MLMSGHKSAKIRLNVPKLCVKNEKPEDQVQVMHYKVLVKKLCIETIQIRDHSNKHQLHKINLAVQICLLLYISKSLLSLIDNLLEFLNPNTNTISLLNKGNSLMSNLFVEHSILQHQKLKTITILRNSLAINSIIPIIYPEQLDLI